MRTWLIGLLSLTFTQKNTHTHIHIHIQTHTHTHTHIHTHTHTQTDTHTHTHTHRASEVDDSSHTKIKSLNSSRRFEFSPPPCRAMVFISVVLLLRLQVSLGFVNYTTFATSGNHAPTTIWYRFLLQRNSFLTTRIRSFFLFNWLFSGSTSCCNETAQLRPARSLYGYHFYELKWTQSVLSLASHISLFNLFTSLWHTGAGLGLTRWAWWAVWAGTTHGGDQTSNFWISKLDSFPVHSLECRGLQFTPLKTCLKYWEIP